MSENGERKKGQKGESFEEYVKQHGEEEAVPCDDVLRRAVSKPPLESKKRGKSDDA